MGSPLTDGGRLDGSRPPDAGPTFTVDCGRDDRYTSPRRPIAIEATTMTSTGSVSSSVWTLESTPSASMPMFTPGTTTAGLTPDLQGDYRLHFEATNSVGQVASCDVTVHSVVGPPIAICPEEEVVTSPNVPVRVLGDGYDDNGIVDWLWTITNTPSGASPTIAPTNMAETSFTSSTPGRYTLTLRVTDADMASSTCDAMVRVNTPPVVVCPPSPFNAPTRQEATLRATATDDTGVIFTGWDLISRPDRSMTTIAPREGLETRITPDRQGEYLVRFSATDDDGASSSCDVTVIGTPTPPDAMCPDTIMTTPLSTVELAGSAIDDGTIAGYAWSLVDQPLGSSASPPTPPNEQRARMMVDVAGEYRAMLTVTDNDGQSDTCTTLIRAVSVEGLRVEMYWNPPDRSCSRHPGGGCDGSDVDLHLHNAVDSGWNNTDDCYYGNCQSGAVLPWGASGIADDPHLDLDAQNGFGPENINIDRPQDGSYRVGVHYFSDHDWNRPAEVYINIYCGAGSSSPIASFGPVTLNVLSDGNDFWRVADVEVGAGTCRVTDLTSPDGRANIEGFASGAGNR